MPYCVDGGGQGQMARLHGTAAAAEAIIHAFCREHRCTATVRVFTPGNKLWREDEIDVTGNIVHTMPVWRSGRRKAA